ncbi:interleukin-13 receptor subunit alpha-2 isoform X5 [Tachyglossus aculeatus]|uniref:interleukin-13 receptor subunit alpha-2 isoform X5 n=1 Tax=Tachyglossus aculeatus TaxID=9261 RepID=UPI0018F4CE75|nr:interleukin-13 receptor subunit alpha-2 isoform X5 [Tachyglossus aculeatus]
MAEVKGLAGAGSGFPPSTTPSRSSCSTRRQSCTRVHGFHMDLLGDADGLASPRDFILTAGHTGHPPGPADHRPRVFGLHEHHVATTLHLARSWELCSSLRAKIPQCRPGVLADGHHHTVKLRRWVRSQWGHRSQGALGTRVQDLRCVYTNWEQLLCTWRPGEDAPPEADYHLYYWYHGLAQAQVCEDYILAGGRHVGCRFPSLQEAEYQDFNICVNGSFSSPPTSLQPTYFTLQLQNIVQPRPPEGLTLKPKDPEGPLLEWQPPHGLIPPACLEYHIQGKGPLGVLWEHRSADPKVALPQPEPGGAATCVHVRARVNMFCAQDGLWSEWSAELCLPESESRPQVLWAMSALGLGLIGAVVGLLLLGRRHKALLKPIPSVSGSPKALPRTGGEAEGCGSSGVLGV